MMTLADTSPVHDSSQVLAFSPSHVPTWVRVLHWPTGYRHNDVNKYLLPHLINIYDVLGMAG